MYKEKNVKKAFEIVKLDYPVRVGYCPCLTVVERLSSFPGVVFIVKDREIKIDNGELENLLSRVPNYRELSKEWYEWEYDIAYENEIARLLLDLIKEKANKELV